MRGIPPTAGVLSRYMTTGASSGKPSFREFSKNKNVKQACDTTVYFSIGGQGVLSSPSLILALDVCPSNVKSAENHLQSLNCCNSQITSVFLYSYILNSYTHLQLERPRPQLCPIELQPQGAESAVTKKQTNKTFENNVQIYFVQSFSAIVLVLSKDVCQL